MRNIRTIPQLLVFLFIRPIYRPFQWLALKLGVKPHIRVEGVYQRAPFLITHIEAAQIRRLVTHLQHEGFFTEPIASPDKGQFASLRRLDEQFPDRQYHIRIFSDGEVRGHYELTPEDHPHGHMREDILEERHDIFMKWVLPFLKS